jgi:renalase
MQPVTSPQHVAIVGAGMAATGCARSLVRCGYRVTVFEKSRGVGGRMATRRTPWIDADGVDRVAEFDHGAQFISVRHGRFRAALAQACEAGVATPWDLQVHAAWPAPVRRERFVATPGMPALCRHWLQGSTVLLQRTVQRLQRSAQGWQVVDAQGETHTGFDQVVLALPPAQAAVLLAGHRDDWADALAATPMAPCWTLMAVTDDLDWPWDACEPSRGPLAWVVRNDRKPGRTAPAGCATWVGQASAAWSAAHLEHDPLAVGDALRAALKALLPARSSLRWHHSSVHRWRYAAPLATPEAAGPCLWDLALGLGVCGDHLGGTDIEAAWRSGDELADEMVAGLQGRDDPPAGGVTQPVGRQALPHQPARGPRQDQSTREPETA